MRHVFSFEGGEYLSSMGASWFVSYAYYDKVDKSQIKWQAVDTVDQRISLYKRTDKYHIKWLEEVCNMQDDKLNTNTLGLDANEIKIMVQELLSKY
ncbi:hypothetical protein [Treponema phagedenis]|uniref:Uncharacterized protein n=1 Tax=Treponema phagedenis TaxID=162 RepID=A0AAE6M933_TREPH|nr:hypothetical protein [Treponema phagedenis]QEJ99089.1 hypothetical protein FUT82_14535 [Treponema phagedenis]QEK04601.1 hypothetical protein FUT83_12845 [Treponema phagedenis]QEK10257.1 hypothetical protein FUT81_12980 [Treponema phagedenis]